MVIVALSGGISSAYCAKWAFDNYSREEIILYFNDTKWEHPDLYRFLDDLSKYFKYPITVDSDGRNPEQLFIDRKFLANNRVPICSHILKAERLQNFYQDGDVIVFGIGIEEAHRAQRIIGRYQVVAAKTNKFCKIKFPLITEKITKKEINKWFVSTGIKIPELYRLGFSHNNCSGGCVRAGKKQWIHLLKVLPEVYHERSRVEQHIAVLTGKKVSYMKDITLIELQSAYENQLIFDFDNDNDEAVSECVGICHTQN